MIRKDTANNRIGEINASMGSETLAIVVGTVVTWVAVAVFALIPKKLTSFEMFFLFFLDTICELSLFSVLHINLKYIQVNPGIENALADLMFRLIELPLLLVLTSNLLLYTNKFAKWGGVAAIVLFSMMVQLLITKIGILTLHHWNVVYSGILFGLVIAFSRLMTWVIIRTRPKMRSEYDHL